MASSKKLILSLATISCLSSLALANISGPTYAIPYNQGNNYYYTLLGYYPGTQIEIQGNNSTNSIFLGKYAYVKNGDGSKTIYAYVDNSDKINIPYIINKGIIDGSLNIENKKNITKDGSISVGIIDNQGYIKNVYIGLWQDKPGSIDIKFFKNSGIIYIPNTNTSRAVYIEEQTHINTFLNTGIIKADGEFVSGQDYNQKIPSGVNIGRNANVDSFINTGFISGKVGITLSGQITNLINTGTIKSTPITNNNNAGAILLTNVGQSRSSQITNAINTGSLDSNNNGISIEVGTTITNLYNNGTIKAVTDGITFFGSDGSRNGRIENIIIGKQGSIDAQKNAINVDVIGDRQNTQPVSIGLINIQEGAKVSGGQAGIKIASSSNSNNSGSKTVGQIIVAGEVKGGSEGGIVNEGTIKASENSNGKSRTRRSLDESQQSDEENKAAILIKESGQITSTSGYGIVNKAMIDGSIISKSSSNISIDNKENATISGGITNSGSGTLMLNNSGSIGMNDKGYNISNEGDGSVNITSWTIRTDDTTKSLQTLTVGGRSANSVMVENLIVDQSNLNMDELNDINNLVSGVSLNNIKKI
ncbi:hypothetical protein DZC71_07565, partial [Campylobacter hepaticus]